MRRHVDRDPALAVTLLVTATSYTALGLVAASLGLRSRRHAALDIA